MQLCLSISNISALTLFVSSRAGVKQTLLLTAISSIWFCVSLRNAFDEVSASAELQWLKGGTDQVADSRPAPEMTNVVIVQLVRLFAIFLRSCCRGEIGWIGQLGCLGISAPLVLCHRTEIIDLHEKYILYVGNPMGFDQVMAVAGSYIPITSALGMFPEICYKELKQVPIRL